MNNINIIFKKLDKFYGKAQLTELDYYNTYTLLIATLLSAQATDKSVNKATNELFKSVNTPEKMLELGEDKLKKYIKSINYFNTKARHIIALSKILVEKYKSQVPKKREDLESLPGVGRKTANIVLNIAFGELTIAVDTHVFRVSNRLGITNAKNVLESEKQLLKIIPKKYLPYVNNWLVLFGRYICEAKKPKCEECFLQELCLAYSKTQNY